MNYPTINIFVTCEYATMGLGDRPTVVDVFGGIHFRKMPASYPFTMFARLLAEAGKYPIRIEVQHDSEAPVSVFDGDVTVGEGGTHHFLFRDTFSFDEPGRYTYMIHSGDKLLGRTYLDVTVDPPPKEATTT